MTEARRTWFGRSRNQAQSGERATAGPIITGQRKPDKLLAYPYSTYQTVLHDALLRNPRLLIAGYGFGDIHFNRLLRRLTRIHGNNRRVVLIDFVPARGAVASGLVCPRVAKRRNASNRRNPGPRKSAPGSALSKPLRVEGWPLQGLPRGFPRSRPKPRG